MCPLVCKFMNLIGCESIGIFCRLLCQGSGELGAWAVEPGGRASILALTLSRYTPRGWLSLFVPWFPSCRMERIIVPASQGYFEDKML